MATEVALRASLAYVEALEGLVATLNKHEQELTRRIDALKARRAQPAAAAEKTDGLQKPLLAADALVQLPSGRIQRKRVQPMTSTTRHLAPYVEKLKAAMGVTRTLEIRVKGISKVLRELPTNAQEFTADDWEKFGQERRENTKSNCYRLCWQYYVAPQWRREQWTNQEIKLLWQLGNKSHEWNTIAEQLAKECKSTKRRLAVACLIRFQQLRRKDQAYQAARKKKPNAFSCKDDRRLILAVYAFCRVKDSIDSDAWTRISACFMHKTPSECKDRFKAIIK